MELKVKVWAVFFLALITLSASWASGEELKLVPTFLGPLVAVPPEVPNKPKGVAPFILSTGDMALVVYSIPSSDEDIDYAEVIDLGAATTVGIVWTKGGFLFLVVDEGLLKNSAPTGTLIFAPADTKNIM